MTLTPITAGSVAVSVSEGSLIVRDLSVTHGEAVTLVRAHLAEHGHESAADLIRRALPVGLVALSMGTAGIDTGSLARTLDAFAETVDEKSRLAIAGLDDTLTRLHSGEAAVAQTAAEVLGALPSRVEAALAGQAQSVRASVTDAARSVQSAGLDQLTTALERHSASVREALTVDRDGTVHELRRDLLGQLDGTRRELGEQLSLVRGLIEAAQAAQTAGSKSSRAVGAANETSAMALVAEVVTAAGDFFEAVGGQAGAGTTRRTGDGIATLGPAVAGPDRKIRIVLEAKSRSRPMTAKALRAELAEACRVRDAVGGIVLVPTRNEVPGGGAFARLETAAYVVATEDLETVSLIYLLLREQVAVLSVRQHDTEVDLTQIEGRLKLALEGLVEFDEVARLATQAKTSLEKLIDVGGRARAKVKDNLTTGISLLHT